MSIQIQAREFKGKCLKLVGQVQQTREEIVITKHGKPVAKLVPCEEPAQPVFGFLAGLEPDILIDSSRLTGTFHGDSADRIFVATARDLGACSLTRDGKILEYAARGFLAAKAI